VKTTNVLLVNSLVLLLSSSCIHLYRANLGLTGKSTNFRSKIVQDNGNEKIKRICVRDDQGTSTSQCGNNGLESYNNPSDIIPSIELRPNYFGKSKFGYSTFFDYNYVNTILVSYPFDGDETKIKSSRLSINPFLFYNFGDRFIKNETGMSFRLGIGPSINYVPQLKMKRLGQDESFHQENLLNVGTNLFIEANYHWFTLRVMNSSVNYEGTKFENAPNETLQADSVSVGFYYSLYIGDLTY